MTDEPKQTKRIATNNREMSAEGQGPTDVFFFPKRNPPISVRAASREEAERILLEADNQKEV